MGAPRVGAALSNLRVMVAAALLLLPSAASAQYFGENKVQYRHHEFQVLETDHFDIYFHQDAREAVDMAARLAERWWRRLSRFFGRELSSRQVIVLYSSHADFEQTSIVSGLIDGGTGGLTEPWRRRIALPFAGSLADTDHVLGHEIVHAFQLDLLGSASSSPSPRAAGAEPLPLWVIEGMAEYLTLGPVDPHTAMWLRDAVQQTRLPSLEDLRRPAYFPYRWGHAFWAFVGGQWGDAVIVHAFEMASLIGIAGAIEDVFGVTVEEFTRRWHAAIRAAYPQTGLTAVGTHVVGAQPLGGSINVGAAVSPDGRWVACLSDRLFAIDLVVVDASSGRIAKTLTDMAVDRRYSSLPFTASAAAWDWESRRVAIGTLSSGRAAIAVFGWPAGVVEQDIVIEEVDEIIGPAWSPDGGSLAFSAMSDGVLDLFIHDLKHSTLRRLTDDAFADVQPAWAPDGRHLAFATDRFTTDLATLTPGPYRLAIVDVQTGAIRSIAAFESGKHIAPQWSPDGRSLYFVSDTDGTSNLYAIDVETGAITRLTAAETGISGLTASSPSLSVAARAGTAAVSVYEQGGFAIHTLGLSGAPALASPSPGSPRLPPAATIGGKGALDGDTSAAPAAAAWRVSKYRRRLALDGISQVTLSGGVDPFGATGGGGLAVSFSDVLNTHWLVGAAQLTNPFGGFSVRDIAGYGAYLNHVHRWHWGLIGSVVPLYVGTHLETVESEGASVPSVFGPLTVLRQTERAARGTASYAFSRARRLELHGGIARLTFDALAGLEANGSSTWRTAAAPLTLANVAAAFVSDTSHAGPTSVVRGERYRLEIAPVVGSIQYLNLIADYRRYLMPAPFYTVAGRALHVGRYGSGADDARLPPFYLGYPWLVRGYHLDSHVVDACASVLASGCPEIEGLLGSRLAVGNLELRFPLLRPFGLSTDMYGPVPVEVAVFLDGGVAWRARTNAAALSGRGAWSTGVTLRTSLLGFGLGQFDIAYPFRNPAEGWVVQFNLASAF
jgi:hypothetical protein